MEAPHKIIVEVAYGNRFEQAIICVKIPAGTSLIQAIKLSGILERFPEIDLNQVQLGIFGKRIMHNDNYQLRNQERIEIYRPLHKTPNQKRLERCIKNICNKKYP